MGDKKKKDAPKPDAAKRQKIDRAARAKREAARKAARTLKVPKGTARAEKRALAAQQAASEAEVARLKKEAESAPVAIV